MTLCVFGAKIISPIMYFAPSKVNIRRERTAKMKPKSILTVVLMAILALSVGGFAISSLLPGSSAPDTGTAVSPAPTVTSQTAVGSTVATQERQSTSAAQERQSTSAKASGGIDEYEYAYAGFAPVYANLNIPQWNLLLVNRNYILPDDYEVDLAPSITADSDSMKLDSRVAPHYNDMYLAAKADGILLTPVSGYRSTTRQKNNFENKISYYRDKGYSKAQATQLAARIILPPGTSEHNAGLAMDICSLDVEFEQTAEFKWLRRNAADYGFILRYPENKQSVTEITYEPWHWRYVGVEAAKAMQSSGQCLEEYLGVK